MEIHITDQLLLRLAANTHVRRAAPIFMRLRGSTRNRGCGRCKRKQANSQTEILQAIKRQILTSESLRNAIKRATGANRLIVHTNLNNRVVKRAV